MISFIDNITKTIAFIAFISFLTMLFSGLIEGGIGKKQNLEDFVEDFKNTVWFKYAFLATILSFLGLFSFAEYYKSLVRKEIATTFQDIDLKKSVLYINNTLTKSDLLINSIKNISNDLNQRLENRSIEIKLIKDKEVIILDLAKSTQDSTLYGVYYPKYSSSDANCVGFIKFEKVKSK